jgi:hypothetical protein
LMASPSRTLSILLFRIRTHYNTERESRKAEQSGEATESPLGDN